MKKLLVRLFCLVCAAGLVFSLWNIWTILSEYREGDRMYESAASQYVSSQPEQQAETDLNKVPIQVDFDHLKAQNPDVVGWLYCEGTPINYPVMQGRTNDDYLYTMLDGSYNKAGSLFLDCAADPGFQDPAPGDLRAQHEKRFHVRHPARLFQAGILRCPSGDVAADPGKRTGGWI